MPSWTVALRSSGLSPLRLSRSGLPSAAVSHQGGSFPYLFWKLSKYRDQPGSAPNWTGSTFTVAAPVESNGSVERVTAVLVVPVCLYEFLSVPGIASSSWWKWRARDCLWTPGYNRIQQNTSARAYPCQVAHNTSRYGRNTKKISYPCLFSLTLPLYWPCCPRASGALLLIAESGSARARSRAGRALTVCLRLRGLLRRRRLDGLELVPLKCLRMWLMASTYRIHQNTSEYIRILHSRKYRSRENPTFLDSCNLPAFSASARSQAHAHSALSVCGHSDAAAALGKRNLTGHPWRAYFAFTGGSAGTSHQAGGDEPACHRSFCLSPHGLFELIWRVYCVSL